MTVLIIGELRRAQAITCFQVSNADFRKVNSHQNADKKSKNYFFSKLFFFRIYNIIFTFIKKLKNFKITCGNMRKKIFKNILQKKKK